MPMLVDGQDRQCGVHAVTDALVERRRHAHTIDGEPFGIADAREVVVLKPAKHLENPGNWQVCPWDKGGRRLRLETTRLPQPAPEQPAEDITSIPAGRRSSRTSRFGNPRPDAWQGGVGRQIKVL